MRLLERVAIVLVSLALAVALIILLSGGLLGGRDTPLLYGSPAQFGTRYPDQGDAILAPGAPRPRYDSAPPTSGAHHARAVVHDGSRLSDDQLLQALAVGNVVFMYGTRRPPSGLGTVARSVAGTFTPALARAGQAVILAWRPGVHGLLSLAWTRTLRVTQAGDTRLRSFALYWLGQGAGG
jgi:hypothetical protein